MKNKRRGHPLLFSLFFGFFLNTFNRLHGMFDYSVCSKYKLCIFSVNQETKRFDLQIYSMFPCLYYNKVVFIFVLIFKS